MYSRNSEEGLRVCVCVCVRACARACVRVCVCVLECLHLCLVGLSPLLNEIAELVLVARSSLFPVYLLAVLAFLHCSDLNRILKGNIMATF